MARQPRPSELHRLPTEASRRPVPPVRAGGRRGRPGWAVLVGLLAVAVGGAGILLGPEPRSGEPAVGPGGGPLVDVAAEDEVVIVLDVFAREAEAVAVLRSSRDPLAAPGPAEAAARATAARRAIDEALDRARLRAGASPAATAYIRADGHRRLLSVLREAEHRAEAIALLAAAHDTVSGGADTIALLEIQQQLTGRFGPDSHPELRRWSEALLAQLDGAEAAAPADAARAEALDAWAAFVSASAPAATDRLHRFLDTVSPQTLGALQGHPVAGPALHRLGRGV